MVRIAINGYGRIGRIAHRVVLEKHLQEAEVVAINVSPSTDLKGWMYLLKYDTVYGPIKHAVTAKTDNLAKDSIGSIVVDEREVHVFCSNDPAMLPWKELGIDVVIEATGVFRNEEDLKAHIAAGAKKVVLAAPPKEGHILTCVLSVNQEDYKNEKIVSNASCTTNCITPVAQVMLNHFGIEKAMMTTIHGYTSDQRLQDGGHKDYRRGRAGALNIIPTSTGATNSAIKILPVLSGKFAGLALRVPVAVGSLSDFTFLLEKPTTVEEINSIFKKESESQAYKGIIGVTEDPLVSSDVIGSSYSAIVDLTLTQVVDGTMAKVIAWYDNEYGYANRLVEEAIMVGKS